MVIIKMIFLCREINKFSKIENELFLHFEHQAWRGDGVED